MPQHGRHAARPKPGLSQIAAAAWVSCYRKSTAAIAFFVESISTPAATQPPKPFRVGHRKSSTISPLIPRFRRAAPASSASLRSRADTPAIERLFGGNTGKQFKNGGGEHCPAIEIYHTGRYFCVTGESVGPTDILRQVPLADLEWIDPRGRAKVRAQGEPKKRNHPVTINPDPAKPFARAPRSKRPGIPIPPCATRCSPTRTPKFPNGREPKVSPTTNGNCTGFMIMRTAMIPHSIQSSPSHIYTATQDPFHRANTCMPDIIFVVSIRDNRPRRPRQDQPATCRSHRHGSRPRSAQRDNISAPTESLVLEPRGPARRDRSVESPASCCIIKSTKLK